MQTTALLDGSHLSLIARDRDSELDQIHGKLANPVAVSGRADVEEILNKLAHIGSSRPKTLDLIGHSVPDSSLLMLGDWLIDGTKAKVCAFFRGLADCEVLPRLGIRAIRLLGCETATSQLGKQTLLQLSEITRLEVFGTLQVTDARSFDADGFRADLESSLLSATDVRRQPVLLLVKRGGEPYRRTLDIELMPASPLSNYPASPRKIADITTARSILQLIRRTDGAQMAGLVAQPMYEVALPSTKPNWFHRLEVMLNGDFIRVYPDGDDRPGVLFPVSDARLLLSLVTLLPGG